jgi:hypothetical protein
MPDNKAVLEESHDERGTCVRWVSLTPDGSLRLEGHDLGPMVQQFFGHSEYEFVRSVPASGVDRLRNALGLGTDDDLIATLAAQFQGEGGSSRLEKFFESQAIESEFWNRIGD